MVEQGLKIGNKIFTNRLFTGTGKFSANAQIPKMLEASGSQMITVALRRIDVGSKTENILNSYPITSPYSPTPRVHAQQKKLYGWRA